MKKIIILGFVILSLLMVLLFTCSIFEGLNYDQWVAKYNTTTTMVSTTTTVGVTTTTVGGTTTTTTIGLPGKLTVNLTGSKFEGYAFYVDIFARGSGPSGLPTEEVTDDISSGSASVVTSSLVSGSYDIYCWIDATDYGVRDVTGDRICPMRTVVINGDATLSFTTGTVRLEITGVDATGTGRYCGFGVYHSSVSQPPANGDWTTGNGFVLSAGTTTYDLTDDVIQGVGYYIYGAVDMNGNFQYGDSGDKYFGPSSTQTIGAVTIFSFDYTTFINVP